MTSSDDNDVCNLGSINLANISTIEEMQHVVKYATLFLLCGTLYSLLPLDEIKQVREKNRRLGLGLMGIHEWLLTRNYLYQENDEFTRWLEVYATSDVYAEEWSHVLNISKPVKTRAIAPTG